jgi:TATA-box binding protein (TBP) (component of TFIID and TFIIIB)
MKKVVTKGKIACKFADRFVNRLHGTGSPADVCFEQMGRDYLALQNVVADVEMGILVDNRRFAVRRPCAYVPSGFGATAVVRYAHIGQTTILLFNTGRVVVVGSKSPEQTIHAIHRLRLALAGDGVHTDVADFELVNMVFVAKIDGIDAVDVASVYKECSKNSYWEPKTFPGLRMIKDNLLLRIFEERAVIMGAAESRQLRSMLRYIGDLCERHQCGRIPPPEHRYRHRMARQRQVLANIPVATNLLADPTS